MVTVGSDNPFPSMLIVEGTEPAAPASGRQRLYIDSTTHKLKRTDSSGTDVTIEAAAGLSAIPVAIINRTSGNLTITNDSSWHDVPTIGDLTIAAAVGDVLEVTLGVVISQAAFFEVQLVTSGNYVGPGVSSTQGIASWAQRISAAGNVNGSLLYTVVSGDISGGNVALRLRYTTNSSGATTLFASTAVGPLFFAVKNLKH
jgi:hypothetical protein